MNFDWDASGDVNITEFTAFYDATAINFTSSTGSTSTSSSTSSSTSTDVSGATSPGPPIVVVNSAGHVTDLSHISLPASAKNSYVNINPWGRCEACRKKYNDGKCHAGCNTAACLFDGDDCAPPPVCGNRTLCAPLFGDGTCEPACNSTGCGYDGGDCLTGMRKSRHRPYVLRLLLNTTEDAFSQSVQDVLRFELALNLHARVELSTINKKAVDGRTARRREEEAVAVEYEVTPDADCTTNCITSKEDAVDFLNGAIAAGSFTTTYGVDAERTEAASSGSASGASADGALVGGVIGGIVAVLLLLAVVWMALGGGAKRRPKTRQTLDATELHMSPVDSGLPAAKSARGNDSQPTIGSVAPFFVGSSATRLVADGSWARQSADSSLGLSLDGGYLESIDISSMEQTGWLSGQGDNATEEQLSHLLGLTPVTAGDTGGSGVLEACAGSAAAATSPQSSAGVVPSAGSTPTYNQGQQQQQQQHGYGGSKAGQDDAALLLQLQQLVAAGAVQSVSEILRGWKPLSDLCWREGQMDGHALLQLACGGQAGSTACVELLLAAGSPPTLTDDGGRTPAHELAGLGRVEPLRTLCRAGANTGARDAQGMTPLMLAAREGHVDCVRVLVEAGAALDVTDNTGRTALHWAAVAGAAEAVRALAAAGANINAVDRHDWSPLHCAVREGNEATVRALAEVYAKRTQFNSELQTPRDLATLLGHDNLAAYLDGLASGKVAARSSGLGGGMSLSGSAGATPDAACLAQYSTGPSPHSYSVGSPPQGALSDAQSPSMLERRRELTPEERRLIREHAMRLAALDVLRTRQHGGGVGSGSPVLPSNTWLQPPKHRREDSGGSNHNNKHRSPSPSTRSAMSDQSHPSQHSASSSVLGSTSSLDVDRHGRRSSLVTVTAHGPHAVTVGL